MNYKLDRITDHIAPCLILIVFICLMLVLFAAVSGVSFPQQALLIQVLLGGFIGGITNKIAITMLFEKKWFLPGSGVLLKKHKVNIEKAEQIVNNIIDEFRDDVREYLRSPKVHEEIRSALKTKLGFLGKFLNVTRIKEYDEMADAIVRELDERIGRLKLSKPMIARTIQKVGTLEDFLFKPGNELVMRHYHTDRSLAQLFFDRIDIKGMVTEKLSAYEPSRVRDIIEENIRSHLIWLEVFGVLLGMLFSGGLYFVLHTMSVPF